MKSLFMLLLFSECEVQRVGVWLPLPPFASFLSHKRIHHLVYLRQFHTVAE